MAKPLGQRPFNIRLIRILFVLLPVVQMLVYKIVYYGIEVTVCTGSSE